MTKKILFIKKDEKGGAFWIHDKGKDILDCEIGPYNTRLEAKDDIEGLTDTILSEPEIWPVASLVSKKRKSKIDDS